MDIKDVLYKSGGRYSDSVKQFNSLLTDVHTKLSELTNGPHQQNAFKNITDFFNILAKQNSREVASQVVLQLLDVYTPNFY